MFEAGLKLMGIRPATESIGHDNPFDDHSTSKVSRGGVDVMITNSAMHGIIRAFVWRMIYKGTPKEEITAKVNELVRVAHNNGDIADSAHRWLLNADWYSVSAANAASEPCNMSLGGSGWELFREAQNDALFGTALASEFVDLFKSSLTENEQAIIDQYRKAAEAYNLANSLRKQYFGKKASELLKSLTAKYADLLRQMDSDLLQHFSGEFYVADNPGDAIPTESSTAPVSAK